MATIFNGNKFAIERLSLLKERVASLSTKPKLVSVVFQEDAMGMLYTSLKAQAAQSVGINFEKIVIKSNDSNHRTMEMIKNKCQDFLVTGLLIQKPNKYQYTKWILGEAGMMTDYTEWWEELTSAIEPKKDVDCLTRANLDRVYRGESDFLPATAQAVVSILELAVDPRESLKDKEVVVVGRSELVGKPLAAFLQKLGAKVRNLGTNDDIKQSILLADIVVSATGKASLISGDMIKKEAIIIDVGEPKGDVDFATVQSKAAFITPVPGGVGPVTVASLLHNLFKLPVI